MDPNDLAKIVTAFHNWERANTHLAVTAESVPLTSYVKTRGAPPGLPQHSAAQLAPALHL